MRRAILVIVIGSLALVGVNSSGGRTGAQAVPAPISNPGQLELPASAFPSDYKEDGNEAWPTSYADTSTFSKEHVKSYSALGLLGAWYQYYDKIITSSTTPGVIVVSPVEVAYLGTYYMDAATADAAFSDILSNPQVSDPAPCSYGTRCITFHVDLEWNGPTYSGVDAIVEQGNAVAEIRADVFKDQYDQVGTAAFATNVDNVAQAFVQVVSSLGPTNTPVPPTATPTSTAAPTPPPTATPTNIPTPTPIPLSFRVLSVRAEKQGSKPDLTLRRAPIKQVKMGTKLLLSIYTLVQSAPPNSRGTAGFLLTSRGRTVLHRTAQMTIPSTTTATYRWTASFKPTKPGRYTFRGTVTIDGQAETASATIRVTA